jgi:hypothetical protein
MRQELLSSYRFDFLVKIGEWGFRSAHAAGAFTALVGLSAVTPRGDERFFGVDAHARKQAEKSSQIRPGPQYLSQASRASADARISSTDQPAAAWACARTWSAQTGVSICYVFGSSTG